jgi:hypothetical protein
MAGVCSGAVDATSGGDALAPVSVSVRRHSVQCSSQATIIIVSEIVVNILKTSCTLLF